MILPMILRAMNLEVIDLETVTGELSCAHVEIIPVTLKLMVLIGVNVATVYLCQHQQSVFVVKK